MATLRVNDKNIKHGVLPIDDGGIKNCFVITIVHRKIPLLNLGPNETLALRVEFYEKLRHVECLVPLDGSPSFYKTNIHKNAIIGIGTNFYYDINHVEVSLVKCIYNGDVFDRWIPYDEDVEWCAKLFFRNNYLY